MNATKTYTDAELTETLGTFTNRDEAGRHFTERYDDDVLDVLESAGYIEINRPVHQPTGISYDRQYWHAEVTEAGLDFFNANRTDI